MKAAQINKVKKVVLTSSTASVASGNLEKNEFDESDWSIIENCDAYPKSKTLAEKAAWDFVSNLPDDEKFNLVVINPSFITGPNLNEAKFSSGDLIEQIMMGKMPGMPKMSFPAVDVRNVAQAHLEGVLRDEANGKRFILVSESMWLADMAKALQSKFDTYPIKTNELGKWMVWLGSFFDKKLVYALKNWGRMPKYNSSRSVEVLGLQYIPIDQSLKEMGDTLIATGYVEDKRVKE